MVITRFTLLGFALLLAVPTAAPGAELDFNRDVRPILSNHCIQCHGPDEEKRSAKLRLDVRTEALVERDGVRAIVPGRPDESDAIKRIFTSDEDDLMPPPKAKRSLTQEQKQVLKRWIAEGATYRGHWAFEPVAKPVVPALAGVAHPIDAFIRQRLAAEGMTPSAETDRSTLIRRVSLDLTGLLPTPQEVQSFVADRNTGAYERVVDRLLASPHYGERWGRHWLDQARYADSNGYSIDSERVMWPYRDWVIKVLNEDLPFSRFTIEQLAGDLLPKPTRLQLAATAFHRNTMINEEGGTDPEQFRVEAAIDRTNTTGAVWLGLTVGCAQCHTHKYDPITHREYYQLYAFFNSGTDKNNKGAILALNRSELLGVPTRTTPTTGPAVVRADWEREERARLEHLASAGEVRWQAADYGEYESETNGGLRRLSDNSLLSDGKGSENDTYRVTLSGPLPRIAALRLRALTHESLPKRGPGWATNGNFVLTDVEVEYDGRPVPIIAASADHEQPGYPVSATFDGQAKTGWAVNIGKGSKPGAAMNADHEAVFVLERAVVLDGKPLTVRLRHRMNERYALGRFAFEIAETVPRTTGTAVDGALLAALQMAEPQRTPAHRALIDAAFATTVTGKADAKAATTATQGELLVMKELDQPRPTFIHLRGDFLTPDHKTGELTPDTLAVLPALGATSRRPTRLDLARWLVRDDNPLTPRVTVNRVWMRYFGIGLVETENDFGTQGDLPTHPELLDWLAGEFVRSGWSMKALHRLIVTSATYRQSSHARPELVERDPRNLLLARQHRLRVDAEVVRDAALGASGLLDLTLGGPTVRPPQPDGVYAFTQNKKVWNTDQGPARYRRALYTQFIRSAAYPLFTTFDAPNFSVTCTRRTRSNTPLQALTLANDEAFQEMARALAVRLWEEIPAVGVAGDRDRIARAFVLCYGRSPDPREAEAVGAHVARQTTSFAADPSAAMAVAGSALPPGVTPTIGAAWTALARALLNTDEFITRE